VTPTDAARMITGMKHSGAKQFLVCEHGEAIASALLDAEETLTRAGWTKLEGAARWKPPVNKDAYAPKFFEAQARIADLEGALRQICELTEDYEHNQQLSEVWYVANDALTPEGGGK